MVNDVGEDIGIKLLQLEEKTNKLEAAISGISKETNSVLSDVRTVLTELENPMNYLKGLGMDEVMLTMAENITEKKLKEFMEKRLESLVRTVVEGKLKESLEAMITKFVQEQSGPIIEAKIKEMREKGLLKVPIDVEDLKRALDERPDVLTSEQVKLILETHLRDLVREEAKKVLDEKMKESLTSLKSALLDDLMKDLSDPLDQLKRMNLSQNKNISYETPTGDAQTTSIVGITACASALMQIFGRRGAERVVEEYYKMGRLSDDVKSSLLRALSVINSKGLPEERETDFKDHLVVTYLFDKLVRNAPDIDFLIALNLMKSEGG
ncbi:MAG: hypothetical protein ACP5KV_03090 [Candidatus Methanomethylicaceae archaeon]